MPCEVLIRATSTDARFKGDPQEVRDDSDLIERPWGGREGPPEFVILHVTDATAAQIQTHMDAVVNQFTYTIQAQNENGWRILIEINPKITETWGLDKGFRDDVRDYMVATWDGQVFDYDNVGHAWAIMDFPKPLIYIPDNVEMTLQDMKNGFIDKFEDSVFRRRYHFSEADVDQVLGLGGKVDQTLAQVAAKVIDRLA